MPSQLEFHHQRSFIQWIGNAKTDTDRFPDLDMLFAVPNGANLNTGKGRKSKAAAINQGAKLKKEGVRAGIPDLMLPVPRTPFHGLFIEFKRPKVEHEDGSISRKGIQTTAQKKYMDRLGRLGYKVLIAYKWSEARDAILDYYGVKQ